MKANIIKATVKRLNAMESDYPVSVRLEAIMLALKYNANHASSRSIGGYRIDADTIRSWLRATGFEGAINSYHWKY